MPRRSWIPALAALLVSCLGASSLAAQVCHGTPARGGLAFEYAALSVGKSYGVAGALAGRRTALGLGLRMRDISTDVSGQEAALRFSLVLGSQRLSICPGIGLGYLRDKWEASNDISVTSHTLMARVGAGLGYELPEYRGVTLAPYASVHYEFAAKAHDVDVANGETDVTGDTLSHAQIEWGLVVRYKFLFAAFANNHSSDHPGYPYMSRLLIGLARGGGSRSALRGAPVSLPRRVR